MNAGEIFALSPDLLCVLGPDDRLLDVNPAWERAAGAPAEALRGQPLRAWLHPDDDAVALAWAARIRQRGEPAQCDARLRGAGGAYRWLSWRGAPGEDEGAIVATARDVDELYAGAQLFEALCEATPDFVAITTLDGAPIYVNPATRALLGDLGIAGGARPGQRLARAVERQMREEILPAVLRDGIWAGESVLEDQDGKPLPISRVTVLLRDEDGAPEALGTIARDERAQKERAARAQKLRALLESTSDLVGIADPEGRMLTLNPAGLAMIGRSEAEIAGLSLVDLVAPADAERVSRAREAALSRGIWEGEARIRHARGDETPTSAVVLPIYDESGEAEALGVVARDRTRHEALETAMMQAIRVLSTPILQLAPGVLALPLIGRVDPERAARTTEALLEAIVRTGCRVAILDMTGADGIDAETIGHTSRLVAAASLLGSRCVLSGISPRMAQATVELGEATAGLRAFGTLRDALRYARGASG